MSRTWFTVYAFVLGACIGSFLNVCIHRLPLGRSIRNPPRSACPRCGMPIRARDNVPLASWLLLAGRCRDCHGVIHWRYPLVELLCGLLAAGLALRYGPTGPALVGLLLAAALVTVAFIDLDHRIIPDRITLAGAPIGLAAAAALTPLTWRDGLLGLLVGAGILLLVSRGYRRVTGREGMGDGDVKLMALVGAVLGWQGAVFTIMAAAAAGMLAGLAVLRRSPEGLRTAVPFGPFLAFGALLYLLAGPELIRLYFRLLA